MKLIFLGPPGAGKGTQAKVICAQFQLAHISTGDMLRAAIRNQTETGLKAKTFMDKGELVPDEVVIALVRERVAEPDCDKGYILDGFPRTVAQAVALEKIASIDAVIDIAVPDDHLVKRLSGRRVYPVCGATYHIDLLNGETKCAKDGTALIQRDDDKAETVLSRLNVYHQKTAPLIAWYEEKGILHTVNGSQPLESVSEEIANVLKALS